MILSPSNRAIKIIQILEKYRPNAHTELKYRNPLEFMIAVMLSAQATDKSVNKVTPKLFDKYKNAVDYAKAPLEELEKDIKSINFYKTKAKRIKNACAYLVGNFNGRVPQRLEDLIKIPGIARKSANVILQEAFNIVEGIVVDTHVARVSQRLGFTKEKSPVKIEKDLMGIIPPKYWKEYSTQMVLHGRYICTSRNPKCGKCPISHHCPSAFTF